MTDRCPKCGRRGSYQQKTIKGHAYWYFAHYQSKANLKWHYVGKALPNIDKEEN